MANLPEVGLEAVIENLDGFLRGARSIADAYEYVEKAEAKVAKKSPEMAAALEQARKAFVDSGGDIRDWADAVEAGMDQGMNAMEQMAALLGAGAIQQIAGTLGSIGSQMLGLAQDSVMTAARIEELDLVLGNLAEQNELSAAAMRDQVQAIRDQGIQADVAYSLVSQFVRANLDLSKASELARLAQDAAVISMEDSSQALSGLLHGVLTLQPELLRYRGIIVDFQSEYKKWADANDRTVLSLTSSEKQMIALNAALEQGKSIAGTYESAMESASKQLRSIPRYIADLKAEFGEELLPVYSDAIFATKDLLKAMSDLPPVTKSVIASVGTMTGGILKGTSSMVSMGAQVAQLILGLQALEGTAAASALAFLGPVGLVAGLTAVLGVGIVTYLKSNEQANRKAAAAILDTATSYKEYVSKAEDAGLASYTLTEELYNIVKAAGDAEGAIDALAATEAWAKINEQLFGLETGIEFLDKIKERTNAMLNVFGAEVQFPFLERMIPTLTELQVKILATEEGARALGVRMGFEGEELRKVTDFIIKLADRQADLNQLTAWATDSVDAFTERLEENADAISKEDQAWMNLAEGLRHNQDMIEAVDAAFKGFGDDLGSYVTPEVRKLAAELTKLASEEGVGAALAQTRQMITDTMMEAEAEVTEIRAEAEADRERALADHLEKEADLYDDYRGKVGDILHDLAEVDEQLMADRAAAEAKYQADRLAAVAQAAAEMQALLAEQAAEIAEAERALAQSLADIDREYRQRRQDAARDLARDLEEIERDSAANQEAIWADYYAGLEALAEDHNQRMTAIAEKYANERARIEDKYRTEKTEEEIREAEREALMAQLEELRRLQAEGMTGIDYTQMIADVLAALEELKQEELAALEEAQAAEEAAELAAWEERQRKLEERRDAELAAEIAAAEEARQERQRAYEQQLQDLQTAQDREREAKQREHARRMEDLRAQHAAERAEQERRAAEALAQLDQRIAEEKARLDQQAAEDRARLQERLADEKANYAERQGELDKAYGKQIDTINTKTDEQVKTVTDKANEMTQNLIKAWDEVDPAIAAALRKTLDEGMVPMFDQMVRTSYDKGREAGAAYARGFNEGADIHSMPQWAIDAGKDIQAGLAAGMGDVRAAAMQAGRTVQAAVPAGMAAAGGSTTVNNTRQLNLNYTGAPQSETSMRGLITLMEMSSYG